MISFMMKRARDGGMSTVTVILDNKPIPINSSSPHFESIVAALKAGDDKKVRSLLNLKQHIVEFSKGAVELINGEVFYNGVSTKTALTDRILGMLKAGSDITPLVKFLERCKLNPDQNAVAELFLFLDSGNLPITEDGFFNAYKMIKSDWTDCHTGKMDNSIGVTVKQDRKNCDSDRNNECSNGLHFCSESYAKAVQMGQRLVMLKVDPQHVVSIPRDYNNAKGRACEYLVEKEVELGSIKPYYTGEDKVTVITNEPEFPVEVVKTESKKSVTVGSKNASAKLDETKVKKIRKMLTNDIKPSVIAKLMGVHRRSIERIRDGEAWTHVK